MEGSLSGHQVLYPPLTFRLPKIQYSGPINILIRPERRKATARLRREWRSRRLEETPSQQEIILQHRTAREYKEFLEKMRLIAGDVDPKPPRRSHTTLDLPAIERDLGIIKKQIPDRPSYSRQVQLPQPVEYNTLVSAPVQPWVMFYNTKTLDVRQKMDKRGMFFVSPGLSSENVSWRRFQETNQFGSNRYVSFP